MTIPKTAVDEPPVSRMEDPGTGAPHEAVPMQIARDPFLSWPMLTAARNTFSQPPTAAARYSFFQARNAIYHSLSLLGIDTTGRVLVPAYICRAAVDPFVAYGLDVDFYGVNRDCSMDLADLESRIVPETRAVLAVHYFGFPQPLRDLQRICTQRGIALIEDCAHVLTGEVEGVPMGSVGNASVFSWRKFLPVYDGADLVLNVPTKPANFRHSAESGLFTLKAAVNMVEMSLIHTRRPLLRLAHAGIRTAESAFRKVGGRHLKRPGMLQAEVTAVSFDEQSVHWPMSRFSLWVRNHSAISAIVERRRINYKLLLGEFAAFDRVQPLFPALPDNVCPWVFPVVFRGRIDAHLLLRNRGIPAVTWDGVRHPAIPQGQYRDTDFLYENLVFLPLHQSLSVEDIKLVARHACQS